MTTKGSTQVRKVSLKTNLSVPDVDIRKIVRFRNSMLTPLSNNKRLNKDDIAILQGDRETLEIMVTSILANKRLAWLVARSYMELNNMEMAPKGWMEEKLREARQAA